MKNHQSKKIVKEDEESKSSSSSSIVDLKAQCKSLGIKKYSKLNKKELLELLSNHEC